MEIRQDANDYSPKNGGRYGFFPVIMLIPRDPNEKPNTDGKPPREVALVGIDIEVPKCSDHSAVPRAEGGEARCTDDVQGRVERERMVLEKFEECEGTVEQEEDDGEHGNFFVFKKRDSKRPDAQKKKGKSQDARDIEGPVETHPEFFEKPHEHKKKEVIPDGFPGEEGILGGLKFQHTVEIVAHREGSNERDVAPEIAPDRAGNENILLYAIVTKGVDHEPGGEEEKQEREEKLGKF